MSARLIGRTGPTAGTEIVLMDVATIGASAENEIRIAAPGVSRRHARVVKDKDQYFLEDAGATNGTFLNGGRVQREALQHLDVITLGRNVDLIFIRREGDTAPIKSDAITDARLQITDGAEAGTVVEIPKGELTVGRAPSCNVVIASGLVSKVHARLQRTANQVVLQDLQSINGTFVNGTRVESVVVLKNGDTINFAGVRSATVTVAGAASDVARGPAQRVAADEPAFNQEWKTRFVWAPDELALIEQARAEAMQLAALRAPATAPAAEKKPAAPAKPSAAARPAAPRPPEAAKGSDLAAPPASPKPAPPIAPKAAGAQPPPNPAGPVKQAPPVAAEAKPGVAPAPVKPAEIKPPVAGAPIAPARPKQAEPAGGPKPADAVTPAGPAQAVVQSAEAPIRPGSPLPVKPDPASATTPATPQPASVAEGASRARPEPAAADNVPTIAIKASDLGLGDMAAPKAPRLRGVRLLGPGAPVALGLGTFVVGRALGSDVRLDDRQVSRSHARITVDQMSAAVEDLQTVNGTLLNGKEVRTPQVLKTGDTLQFGASEFKVELVTS